MKGPAFMFSVQALDGKQFAQMPIFVSVERMWGALTKGWGRGSTICIVGRGLGTAWLSKGHFKGSPISAFRRKGICHPSFLHSLCIAALPLGTE